MVVLGNMKEMSECYDDIDKLMKFIGGLGRFMDEVFIDFEPKGLSGVFVVMGEIVREKEGAEDEIKKSVPRLEVVGLRMMIGERRKE